MTHSLPLSQPVAVPLSKQLPQPAVTPLPLPMSPSLKFEVRLIPLKTTSVTTPSNLVPEFYVSETTLLPTIDYNIDSLYSKIPTAESSLSLHSTQTSLKFSHATIVPTVTLPKTIEPTRRVPTKVPTLQSSSVPPSTKFLITPSTTSTISSFPIAAEVVPTTTSLSLPVQAIPTTRKGTSGLSKDSSYDTIDNPGYDTDIIINDDGECGIVSSCLSYSAQTVCGSGNISYFDIPICFGDNVPITTNNTITTTGPTTTGITSEDAFTSTFVIPYKYYLGVVKDSGGDSRSGNISAIAATIESKLHQELARAFLNNCSLSLSPLSRRTGTVTGRNKENDNNVPPSSFRTQGIRSFAKIKYSPINCTENEYTNPIEYESNSSKTISSSIIGRDDNHNITSTNGELSGSSINSNTILDVHGKNCYHIQSEFVVVVIFNEQQYPNQRFLLHQSRQQQAQKMNSMFKSFNDISSNTSNSTKTYKLFAVYDAFSDVLKRFFSSDSMFLDPDLNIINISFDHVMTISICGCIEAPSPTVASTPMKGDMDRIIEAPKPSSKSIGSQNPSLQLGVIVGVFGSIIVLLLGWAVFFRKKVRTATTTTSDAELKDCEYNSQQQEHHQHLQHSRHMDYSHSVIRNDNDILPNDKDDQLNLDKKHWYQNPSSVNGGNYFVNYNDELLSAAEVVEKMKNHKGAHLQLVTAVNVYEDIEEDSLCRNADGINMRCDSKTSRHYHPIEFLSGHLNQVIAKNVEEDRIINIHLCNEKRESSKSKNKIIKSN